MKKIGASLVVAFLVLVSLAMATEVDVDMDVDSGNVDIDAQNTEAGSNFEGTGQFVGNFNTVEEGNYLDTNVLVESTEGAALGFSGYQELSGYTNNQIEVETFAYGDEALMNNRFDNSNYVVQLERVDTSQDFLSGAGEYGIGWRMGVEDITTQTLSAEATMELYGDDTGRLDTNQWHTTSTGTYGWGNPDGVQAPNPPSYYTPTNEVSATGNGLVIQTATGTNSLVFNGFNFGSGTAAFSATFSGGMSGVYSMSAS